MAETVIVSLLHSCTTIIIRQGISLHYNPQNKAAIWLILNISPLSLIFYLLTMGQDSHSILILLYLHCAVFLVNSCTILSLISLCWRTWGWFLPSSFAIINSFTFIFSTIHTWVGLNYGFNIYLFLVHVFNNNNLLII